MAKEAIWFSAGGVGATGLSLTFDRAFLVADKSAITPTVDEVGDGWYIVEYSGTGHAAATVNSGSDTTDFRRVSVVWNAPVGVAGSVSGAVGSVTGAVGSVAGAVGSVTGAVGSVTSPVTVGTNNDKTGYGLTSDYDAAKSAASQTSVDTVAGYLDTEIAAILAAVDTEVASILTAVSSAIAEPGSGAPTATPTLREALAYLYANWRNEKTQTATEEILKNDAGTAIAKRTVDDNGTTLTSGKLGAP